MMDYESFKKELIERLRNIEGGRFRLVKYPR